MLNFLKAKFKVKKKVGRPSLQTDAVPDIAESNAVSPPTPVIMRDNISPNSQVPQTLNLSSLGVTENYGVSSSSNGSLQAYNDTTIVTPGLPGSSPSISSKHLGSAHSIVINNASSFHIGDAVNFTLGDGAHVNISSPGLGLSNLGKTFSNKSPQKEPAVNLEELDDVVNERELGIIAQNICNDWKAFGRALTLSDADLSLIERNNSGGSFQASKEMLRHFMKMYPDSSVGFLTSVLNEFGHSNAVRQLINIRS